MSSSVAPTEPTNAELKSLLEQLGTKMEASAQTHAMAIGELSGKVTAQGVKLLEIDRRLTKTEQETKRLRDSQADIEGSLLAEVGALASNDQKQNAKLEAIERETKRQTATLATVVDDTKNAVIKDTKSALKRYGYWVGGAILAAPKFWPLVEWLWKLIGRAGHA